MHGEGVARNVTVVGYFEICDVMLFEKFKFHFPRKNTHFFTLSMPQKTPKFGFKYLVATVL